MYDREAWFSESLNEAERMLERIVKEKTNPNRKNPRKYVVTERYDMEKTATFFRIFIILCLLLAAPLLVFAGEPTNQIKKVTDEVISILKDPSLNTPDKKAERRKLIRAAADQIVDWNEMAKRVLGRYWRGRTDEEKREFIYLFGKLLEKTYLGKVKGYSGEKVIYLGDRVEGGYALGKAKIITKQDKEIEVLYRMKRVQGKWMVYDVCVEGVSLINNYRSQFNSILMRSSFKGLLERLKAKVAE